MQVVNEDSLETVVHLELLAVPDRLVLLDDSELQVNSAAILPASAADLCPRRPSGARGRTLSRLSGTNELCMTFHAVQLRTVESRVIKFGTRYGLEARWS